MPSSTDKRTLAIFGATGRTGSETLKALLAKPTNPFRIRIYVRSVPKLHSLFPDLKNKTAGGDVEIVEGQVTDVARVWSFLSGADTIIAALGENDNWPGVRVLTDLSRTVVAALKRLRDEASGAGAGAGAGEGQSWRPPRLLLLSSATWNERAEAETPALVGWIVKNAFYYPYADLLRAHAAFQGAEAEGVLSLLLVQPPVIVEEEGSGHVIGVDDFGLAASYADLGAGFAELATEGRYAELKAVGVWSKRSSEGFKRYGPTILYRATLGLIASFVPGFWRVNKALRVFS